MLIKLGSFLQGAVGPLAKRVLTSLGFSVLSTTVVATGLNQVIDYMQSTYVGLAGDAASIVGLAGIGEALGMITGAMVFRVAFTTLPKLGLHKQ